MSNRQFLKQFFFVLFMMGIFCGGVVFITENVDYVSTSVGSANIEDGTVKIYATIHIDDDPVLQYIETVNYCDRKEAKKALKKKAKEVMNDFKVKCE